MAYLELQLLILSPVNLIRDNLSQVRPNRRRTSRSPRKRPLAVFRQQLVDLRKCPLSSLMAQSTQSILQYVGRIGRAHHCDGPQIPELHTFWEELRGREDNGTGSQDV